MFHLFYLDKIFVASCAKFVSFFFFFSFFNFKGKTRFSNECYVGAFRACQKFAVEKVDGL